jgi:hypothetical protein
VGLVAGLDFLRWVHVIGGGCCAPAPRLSEGFYKGFCDIVVRPVVRCCCGGLVHGVGSSCNERDFSALLVAGFRVLLNSCPRLVRVLGVKELSKIDFGHMQIVRLHMKPISMGGIRLSFPKLFTSTGLSVVC